MSDRPSVTFTTSLAGFGGRTGVVVPADVMAELDAGKRPPVHVDLNGYQYRSTVAVMGGQYLISVSAAIRDAAGLEAGHRLSVTLTVADTPREVAVPDDLATALAQHEQAAAFFASLSNSLQRYHVDQLNGAKSSETRQRRLDKALELFRAGKKR